MKNFLKKERQSKDDKDDQRCEGVVSPSVEIPKKALSLQCGNFFSCLNQSEDEEETVRAVKKTTLPKSLKMGPGKRRHKRWCNDRHLCNPHAVDALENMMESLSFDVEWQSIFAQLAMPGNEELYDRFRNNMEATALSTSFPAQRKHTGECSEAHTMFMRMPKKTRHILLKNFARCFPFIQAVEQLITYFLEWNEIPSEIEMPTALTELLQQPVTLTVSPKNGMSRISIPMCQSSFHRMLTHGICQFYGLRSKSVSDDKLQKKRILLIRFPMRKLYSGGNTVSMCNYITVSRPHLTTNLNPEFTCSSSSEEDSVTSGMDGFCFVSKQCC